MELTPDQERLVRLEIAERLNFRAASGQSAHTARALMGKLNALGVPSVELDGVRHHDPEDIAECAQQCLDRTERD